ncbi:hypothetical protein PHMEG_00037409 [Phytophthora megakarya]|uniref:Uncharacterized protein n=1 Tax=Phytophthora megakarya TaxID=4795 RepID=A0A225UK06_9STRA|nr:hypothetical protein PHMEG_00037409 [Phytophthora megakarya]
MDEGVSIVDAPAQASVRGAGTVGPPTEDRVSDTSQPVIDVETLDETVTIKDEASAIQDVSVLDVSSPTSSVDSGSKEAQTNEDQTKAYVAGQPWWAAMIATLRHLKGRAISAALDEAWISDLQLIRSEPPPAQDVTPIVIPPSMLSPREYVAFIQTLLVEAGFRFP